MRIYCILLAALILIAANTVSAGETVNSEDLPAPNSLLTKAGREKNGESAYGVYPIRFFSNYISGADGDRCPMYPSCSAYGLESFRTHGLFRGWIMTCDRLMRCGRDELRLSPRIHIHGENRCHDSVRQNDIWRKKEAEIK